MFAICLILNSRCTALSPGSVILLMPFSYSLAVFINWSTSTDAISVSRLWISTTAFLSVLPFFCMLLICHYLGKCDNSFNILRVIKLIYQVFLYYVLFKDFFMCVVGLHECSKSCIIFHLLLVHFTE